MTQQMSMRNGFSLYDTGTDNTLVASNYFSIRDAPRSAQVRTYAFSTA